MILNRYFAPIDDNVIATTELYKGEYEPVLVVLSILIAVACSYVALSAMDNSRAGDKPILRLLWLGLGGVTMGGGIWTMHFIGMLSFSLPCAIVYDPALTLISMIPGIIASWVALGVIRNPDLHARWTQALGGVMMAGGIATMHYSGMAAMRMDAVLYYDPARVGLSVVVAVSLAWFSLALPRIIRARIGSAVLARPLSALGLGLAVAGMHYTAMWAALFAPEPELLGAERGWEPSLLATWITIMVGLLGTAVMAVSFAARQSKLADDMREEVAHRRQAERFAEEQRVRLQAIIDNVVDGIITIDAKGHIKLWSPAAERLFGYGYEEVRDRNVSMLMPEPFRSEHDSYIARHQAGGEARIIGIGREVEGLRKDGTTFPMALSIGHGRVGDTEFYTGTVRDLTVHKQEQAALEEARDRAEAAARAKSEFLANMSHEIRTPMNSVLGFLKLALDSSTLDGRLRRFLSTAHGSATNLLVIIDDILDFSKLESGRVALETLPFDIRRAVEDTAGLLNLSVKDKALSLTWDVEADVPRTVLGDPSRLRQILLNLLSNAVKFTERGSIRIAVSRDPSDGNLLRFAVSDTGIGMTPEVLERVLLPFEQADASTQRRYGGTGLGTTISRSLAEAMGGRMWADSTLGAGSTFHFTARLPAATETALVRQAPITGQTQGTSRAFNVLLAEDIPDNVLLVSEMMKSRGHEVTVVETGAEAVEAVKKTAFDIVLMDIQMPQLDGVAATQQIREAESGLATRLPIIALTASVTEHERARCMAAGMDAVVAKPVNFAALFFEMDLLVPADRGRTLQNYGHESLMRLQPVADLGKMGDWPDADRYMSCLRSFVTDSPGILESVLDHAYRGDGAGVTEVVHTLGAIGESLGLREIVPLARQLEVSLESGGHGIEETVLALRAALDDVRELVADDVGDDVPSRSIPKQPTDPALLRQLFEDLNDALDTDNPDPAEALIDRIAVLVEDGALLPVVQAIHEFDFPEARVRAKRLSSQLGLDQVT